VRSKPKSGYCGRHRQERSSASRPINIIGRSNPRPAPILSTSMYGRKCGGMRLDTSLPAQATFRLSDGSRARRASFVSHDQPQRMGSRKPLDPSLPRNRARVGRLTEMSADRGLPVQKSLQPRRSSAKPRTSGTKVHLHAQQRHCAHRESSAGQVLRSLPST
jgi:hypothetical protein